MHPEKICLVIPSLAKSCHQTRISKICLGDSLHCAMLVLCVHLYQMDKTAAMPVLWPVRSAAVVD